MLLNNNQKRVVTIEHSPAGSDHRGETVVLIPGVNEVPNKVWEVLKKHPHVQLMMDHGHLSPTAEEIPGAEAAAEEVVDSLKGFKEKAALKLVKACNNKSLLDRWKDGEKRPKVLEALELQLEELNQVQFRSDKKEESDADDQVSGD